MRLGEADWILYGLALQAGLCPTDRKPVTLVRPNWGFTTQLCHHCYREWWSDPKTGTCRGWGLTRAGWYYSPEGRPIFRQPGDS